MATITNAKLTIHRDNTHGTVRPVVTCNVNFNQFDRFSMQNGLQFRLTCQLKGQDSGFLGNDDDHLFTYRSKRFTGPASSSTENANFTETISSEILDEDDSFFNRGDEVYGRLTLKNSFTGVQVNRSTNVVKGRF